MNDGGWLSLFNSLYIWATLLALIFGVIALVASNGIRVYSGRLAKVQDKLISDAKERASKADEEAGKAKVSAGQAHERAAKLEVRASEAEAQARKSEAEIVAAEAHVAEANERTALARKEAGEANVKAESFRLDIAKANERAAQAQLATEQAHKENLELEAVSSPRLFRNQDRLAKILAEYKLPKPPILLTYLEDVEALQTAEQIYWVFRTMKWPITPIPHLREVPSQAVSEGISIWSLGELGIPTGPTGERSRDLENTIISELTLGGLSAAPLFTSLNTFPIPKELIPKEIASMPNNAIIIEVGMKPNPLVIRMEREKRQGVSGNRFGLPIRR